MTDTTDNANPPPKSPLEFSWTFWYLKPDKRISWEKSLIKLIDIGFVEDFWATFNHLAVPSRLATAKINSDYYFFRTGSKINSYFTYFYLFIYLFILFISVRPMWGKFYLFSFYLFFSFVFRGSS
jgi:hypothetical protein